MGTHMRGWLGPAALVFASGCGFLLNIDPPSSTGPCKVDGDCPDTYACVEGTCRACPGGASTCTTSDAGNPMNDDAAPKNDAGRQTGDAAVVDGGCTTEDAAACTACEDPIEQVCLCGTCRTLSWSSPESEFARPVPAMLNNRIYTPVPQNTVYAQPIVVPASGAGMVVKLGMLISTNLPSLEFGLALYHDAGGFPSDPFVMPPTQMSTMNAEGRVEVAVDPPVHVAPGAYWMAFVGPQSDFVFQRIDSTIATAETMAQTTGSPWPAPFVADTAPPATMQAQEMLFYAVIALDH
jgi:hypothetical protein